MDDSKKKLKFKKKGQMSFNFIIMIYRLLFVFIVCFSIGFLIKMYMITSIDVKQAESELIMGRMINSPTSLAYERNGRVYIGIIDREKVKSERLDKSISFNNIRVFGAKVELRDKTNNVIETAYADEPLYEQLIITEGFSGPGGSAVLRNNNLIRYYDKGEFVEGMINITLVMPN